MSINLIVNKDILTNEESKLQFMPAKIKDDLSNIEVDKYFNSYTEVSSKSELYIFHRLMILTLFL